MRRWSLLLAALVTLVVVVAPSAGAHTQVRDATPGPGETVGGTVEWVVVEFLDPVQPVPEIDVAGPDGAPVAGLGQARLIADDVAKVEFDPLTEPGAYTVEYRWVALDGAAQASAHQFRFEPDDPLLDVDARTASAAAVAATFVGLLGWALVDRRRGSADDRG